VRTLHEAEREQDSASPGPAAGREAVEERPGALNGRRALTPGTVLALQRLYGNAAVARLIADRRLQRLKVSDEHGERELAIGEGPSMSEEAESLGARASTSG